MSLIIEKFGKIRPFLYHLTARTNLKGISKLNHLLPASQILEAASRTEMLRVRRKESLEVAALDSKIILRDQAPLHQGNASLLGGWKFENLVESINRRVFFWPGTESGPISYGKRHFERYASEKPVVLRVRFTSLIDVNPSLDVQFCKFNSGSPRCSNGKGSPRGPNTFLMAKDCDFRPSQVVEVTFEERVLLPTDVEISVDFLGTWSPFDHAPI